VDAVAAPFAWERQIAGLEGVTAAGDPLPPKTLERNLLLAVRKVEEGLVRDPFERADETTFSGVAEANCRT